MKNRKARQRELLLKVLRAAPDDAEIGNRTLLRSISERVRDGCALTADQVSLLIAAGRSLSVDVSEYLDLVYTRPEDIAKIRKTNQFMAGLEELAHIIPEEDIPFG